MREAIEQHPLLMDRRTDKEKEDGEGKVKVRVNALGDSAITLRAFAWGRTPGDAATIKFDSYKAIKERFDEESIEIPYPYFNQIVKTV
jgi:small-conductance mechanosensitive channel